MFLKLGDRIQQSKVTKNRDKPTAHVNTLVHTSLNKESMARTGGNKLFNSLQYTDSTTKFNSSNVGDSENMY